MSLSKHTCLLLYASRKKHTTALQAGGDIQDKTAGRRVVQKGSMAGRHCSYAARYLGGQQNALGAARLLGLSPPNLAFPFEMSR